jgi:uncharacterized RDD family membrane protein YckC
LDWLLDDPQAVMLFALTTLVAGTHYGSFLSLGRRCSGLQLTDPLGQRPGMGRRWLRAAAALASALVMGAGFYWVLVDPERRTWHDRIVGTRMTPR